MAEAAAAVVVVAFVPGGPAGVASQPALRSVRAAPSPVESRRGGRVRRGRRALTEGGGRGQGGRWDRGSPAQRRPAPGPAGLLSRRRSHGGQREAEAGGEAPEDAAGHDRPPAQPKVLRLRPARPHLREHDGRLLRLYLLFRQPVSAGPPGGRGALPRAWGAGGWSCGGPAGGGGWGAGSRGGAVEARGRDALGPGRRAGDALSISPGEGPGPGQPLWVGRGRGWGPEGAPGVSISSPRGAGAASLGSRLSRALTRRDCRGKTGGGWGRPCGSFVCPASPPGRGGPEQYTCRAPLGRGGEAGVGESRDA